MVDCCYFCNGWGIVEFYDPVTRQPASVLCPACTPEGVDLFPRIAEEWEDD